jgi:hypothetical protein
MLRVFVTPFWLPKAGSAPGEFEDAFCPADPGEVRGARLRFAVADGATEGVCSGMWAGILATAFAGSRASRLDIGRLLNMAYRRWEWWRAQYIRQAEAGRGSLPWYVEHGLRQGPCSTVLGLTLEGPARGVEGTWEAITVGDSCLFHARTGELMAAFPLEDAALFGNRPPLLCSNPAHNSTALAAARTARGQWRKDDQFYLMTDALAAWVLQEHEAGRAPWRALSGLEARDQQPFKAWIEALRTADQIRNDDITLVRIDIT